MGSVFFDQNAKTLDRQEVIELSQRAKAGDAVAVDALVKGNMRFAVARVHRRAPEMPQAERISAAAEALLMAIERFDERKGFTFLTYATHWIDQAAQRHRAELNGGVIRLPAGVSLELYPMCQALAAEDEPVTADSLARVWKERRHSPPPGDPVLHAAADMFNSFQLSLDDPTLFDGNLTISDGVADPNALDEDSLITSIHNEELLQKAMDGLLPRERDVVKRYYGIDTPEETLPQIAKTYGVSRERIRQVRKEAFGKMLANLSRTDPRASKLKSSDVASP